MLLLTESFDGPRSNSLAAPEAKEQNKSQPGGRRRPVHRDCQ